MCRILFAVGQIDMNYLIAGLLAMATDQNSFHERNQKKGLGTNKHGDGWGLAYWQNGRWKIYKSTKAVYNDDSLDKFRSLQPQIALFHVRKAYIGKISLPNTQPFRYKQYVFGHNGVVEETISFSSSFQPKGETDSEKVFYSILTFLHKKKKTKEPAQLLAQTLNQFSGKEIGNLLLSTKDKTYLASTNGSWPKYFQMSIGQNQNTTIISSEQIKYNTPLTWKQIPRSNILELDHTTQSVKKFPFLKSRKICRERLTSPYPQKLRLLEPQKCPALFGE